MPSPYVELQVSTNYSFLRGASRAEEIMATAAGLGYDALAVTDRNTLAGVVRAHVAAKAAGVRLIVGARLDLTNDRADGPSFLCLPTDRAAYGRLARLLTVGRRRAGKGDCHLTLDDLVAHGDGQILVALPPRRPDGAFEEMLIQVRNHFRKRLYLAVQNLYFGDDNARMAALAALAARCRVAPVACNDVHAHGPERRPLQDVLTCIREHCTIMDAGRRLHANGERHLKAPAEMERLFAALPEAIANSRAIADRCRFSLDELRYEYPIDPVPGGRTPQQELVEQTWAGAAERYPRDRFPDGVPAHVRDQLEHELDLIDELGFAPYFLTVFDIVRFARSRGILCQGRGSAANSAVCYCLGVTAVDPARVDLLFERFISAERGEPPDIDVDFEHERREEVIQYVYAKYGRERSGMTATVISYRTKSALREVGKVMGLSDDVIVALQRLAWRRHWDEVTGDLLREAGLDPTDPTLRQVLALARELRGFPRHLSQHTGGMVITAGPLSEVVPIENAAMDERTVIQWDKNDLDALGILKIDLLGLGMLTCVRKAFDLIRDHHGKDYDLATVPAEDPAVYDMLCRGDSVGVFQVESRAQMSMLPRLRPRNFYDLVIEVAIVRPGPIQGDMVHPYLRRRRGEEPVRFPSRELERVLGKTLGVPLFQEQAMKIAIVGAGFSPSEADSLRRAMATFRHHGTIHAHRDKFIAGMLKNGYAQDFAERCFKQIEGFADYGFPESHAASFALLVYVSAWLKRHYPAAFACALLNSQPMGFYLPAQIVRDARDHGVTVRPVDVNASEWDSTLEEVAEAPSPSPSRAPGAGPSLSLEGEGKSVRAPMPSPPGRGGDPRAARGGEGPPPVALRLGLRQVRGLAAADAALLLGNRAGGYGDMADLHRRGGLGPKVLDRLARADAFGSLGLARRDALWRARGFGDAPLPLFQRDPGAGAGVEPLVTLPAAGLGEQVAEDYRALMLSLKAHPLALLRERLRGRGYLPCDRLESLRHGRRASVAGLVVCRQRPGSAKGVIFATLEDETGNANLIVWPHRFEKLRKAILSSSLLAVHGEVQREGPVIHLLVERAHDLSPLLGRLDGEREAPPGAAEVQVRSRDFQ
ncbi:MAG: error-prone DNA polymerase [Hyphomicrobiales bacterium]|nr:error-prone DNA polymerase [Hyphomicrobiales bacterium]